jgi:hypothetical protein
MEFISPCRSLDFNQNPPGCDRASVAAREGLGAGRGLDEAGWPKREGKEALLERRVKSEARGLATEESTAGARGREGKGARGGRLRGGGKENEGKREREREGSTAPVGSVSA